MQIKNLPLLTYLGFYLLTSVFGASLIATDYGFNQLESIYFGLNVSLIERLNIPGYMVFILLPLFIVFPLMTLNENILHPMKTVIIRTIRKRRRGDDRVSVLLILITICTYQFVIIWNNEYYANFLYNFDSNFNYEELILMRQDMMNVLAKSFYYEITYVSFPTLTWFCMYNAIKTKSTFWKLITILNIIFAIYFLLTTIQKAPLLIFFIGLIFCRMLLTMYLSFRTFIYFILVFFILIILQRTYSGDFNIAFAFFHVIYRLSHAIPYYFTLFPDSIPFQEFNYGFGLLGVQTVVMDNIRVYEFMYEGSINGSVTAAAHVRGYTHGGWYALIASLFIVSIVLSFVKWLVLNFRGAAGFSLSVQGLICVYMLTQTSVRGALLESYGYIWAFYLIGMVVFFSIILPYKEKS